MREIELNGERLLLDPAGALWWPEQGALIFADLHLEKGSSFARRGEMLPPYDSRATLGRMEMLFARYDPRCAIALGDTFHDERAAERLGVQDRNALIRIGHSAEWIWIAGNHDPSPPCWLAGTISEEVAIGSLVFRHQPSPWRSPGEIAGHLHPCKTVVRRGRSLRRRCFVSDGNRLVMPAFGAYAGGLDVTDQAVRSLFGSGAIAYLLGAQRVYAAAA